MKTSAARRMTMVMEITCMPNCVPTWYTSAGTPNNVLVDMKLAMRDMVTGKTANFRPPHHQSLEEQISVILIVFHQIGRLNQPSLGLQRGQLCLRSGPDLLLLLLNLLQAEELLSLHLVQFRGDVGNGVLDPRNDHMLQGVHPPVGHLDHLVEGDEGGLEGGKVDQQLDRPLVVLLDLRVLLAGSTEAGQLVGVRAAGDRLEDGQHHPGDVVLLRADHQLRLLDILQDDLVDVVAAGELASASEKSASFMTSPISDFVSTIFRRIMRKRSCRASAFFFSSEWPFWAPFRRAFMLVNAIRLGKRAMRSLPDILI
ncbi:hypothetical protein TYRP_003064 [Tyrophagus putrescentiae]|nr:hypothetical protein TYRP_003064 [Tyrophagus putrescentiae]